jgi:hypothetical protein
VIHGLQKVDSFLLESKIRFVSVVNGPHYGYLALRVELRRGT